MFKLKSWLQSDGALHHQGLTLVKRIFADENHCEVIAPGFQAGLKWALEKKGMARDRDQAINNIRRNDPLSIGFIRLHH